MMEQLPFTAAMPPTQSTVVAAPTPISSPKPLDHHVSIPAMIVLAFFLVIMAALAIGVILRQRKTMAASKNTQKIPLPARARWSWIARLKRSPTSTPAKPTAVGALHATTALLAAAPCQAFSSPMTMHFRIPLQDKTILILGAPWFPTGCRAQCCGALAASRPPQNDETYVSDDSDLDYTLPSVLPFTKSD